MEDLAIGAVIGPFVRVLEPRVLELRPTRVTDESLEDHSRALARFCASNTTPFGILVSLGPLLELSARHRRRFAELEKDLVEHDRRYVVGCAIHAPRAISRGFATAIFWVQPPAYPYCFVRDRDEGLGWIRERLPA